MNLSRRQNTKLVIFDFDGTIADTSEGIIDAHRFTLKAMERKCPSDYELRKVIGRNLFQTYMDTFGFDETEAKKAVKIYRNRYAGVGIHKATVYQGCEDLLMYLKGSGISIGVATLKAEIFTEVMLEELNIADFFDEICGMDPSDSEDKTSLILKCIEKNGCIKDRAVLVGDSINDLTGAKEAGIRFVGVTYGFGFVPNILYEFDTIHQFTTF